MGAASDPSEHLSYLDEGSRRELSRRAVPLDGSVYPSGCWRGYYTYENSEHGVVEFALRFDDQGTLTGEGADDVGCYTIQGRFCGSSGRVAFTKQYQRGTQNAAGRVKREENCGHAVEYRGAPARRDSHGGVVLGGGLKGRWHIEAAGRGQWHLWPVVRTWQTGDGEAASVDNDSECCVCFANPIDTCIEPCGHSCLCASCANRLRPWRCPLCRADIRELRRIEP